MKTMKAQAVSLEISAPVAEEACGSPQLARCLCSLDTELEELGARSQIPRSKHCTTLLYGLEGITEPQFLCL